MTKSEAGNDWDLQINRLLYQFTSKYKQQSKRSEWDRRCDNWVVHFKLAFKDLERRKRKPKRIRDLANWDWVAASNQMVTNAAHAARKAKQNEWIRWSECVAKNTARRSIARAKGNRETNQGVGRETKQAMCAQ